MHISMPWRHILNNISRLKDSVLLDSRGEHKSPHSKSFRETKGMLENNWNQQLREIDLKKSQYLIAQARLDPVSDPISELLRLVSIFI